MKSKKLWIVLIFIGVILAGLYLFGSYFFSDQLINRPTQSLATSQERMGELGVPSITLTEPEAVTIEAGDVTLAGNFYQNPLEGDCAVLMLHGYTSTRYGTLQYAPLFWDRGCDLLAYDARGHGESSDAYHTYGYFEKTDGMAAYEWLQERTGLPASKTALAGVSYGAATSLQMLPLLPDVAFVLADSP
jgi:pimeloyl-ACP methyl ester carboxylesterase